MLIYSFGKRLQTLTEVGRAVGTRVGSSVGIKVLYFDTKLMKSKYSCYCVKIRQSIQQYERYLCKIYNLR